MNRRLLIALTALAALLAGGAAYLARRRPAAPPPEAEIPPFQSQTAGAALLLRHADESTPLRALRWLPAGPGGLQIVQVTTQTDRQRVALFENGSFAGIWLVPRPEGVGEGFFRFAELTDATTTGSEIFLLYRTAEGSRPENPLLLALGRKDGQIRWARRPAGTHLTAQAGPDGPTALWCYGQNAPPQRIDLRTGQLGAPLELPPEIQTLGPLAANRNGLLFIAHPGGLALRRKEGWAYHPAPVPGDSEEPPAPPFEGRLAASPSGLWWQFQADGIVSVRADGSLGEAQRLTLPEPWDRDVRRLRLLGADPDGHLWFEAALSAPTTPGAQESGWEDAGNPSPETASVALVSDAPRVYRFDPAQRRLDQCRLDHAWKALQIPFAPPGSFTGLAPAGGAWTPTLADGSQLWIPLTRLPLTALEPQPR